MQVGEAAEHLQYDRGEDRLGQAEGGEPRASSEALIARTAALEGAAAHVLEGEVGDALVLEACDNQSGGADRSEAPEHTGLAVGECARRGLEAS